MYFSWYTFNIYCLYDIIVDGLKMILFLQVTRDKKNKKIKFFLQYTRHKILLTEIDPKVDIIRKSNNKFEVYEWKDK